MLARRGAITPFPAAASRLGMAALAILAAAGCSTRSPLNSQRPDDPATQRPRFHNVARQSGLAAFRHTDGGSGRKFFCEQIGSGCAIFDYDGDGWQDVYFCSGSPLPGFKGMHMGCRLYRNKGDGTFEDRTDASGLGQKGYAIGAAVGDYNNDGKLDLYLACFGPDVLYRNNGDGTFTDVTKAAAVGDPRFGSSAAWVDYDGNGYLDLYVANYTRYRVEHDLWCSKFAGHKSYCGPTLYPPEVDTLYRNNGDGTFTDVSVVSGIRRKSGNGLGVTWLDYNEDGRWDIFVANDQSPNFLWRNQGNGTFEDVGLDAGVAFGEEGHARAGMGVDVGDPDNNGRPDIVVTNFSEETNALYHNEGDGLFRDIAYPSGMGAATLMFLGFGTGFVDYDRDGWQDLFFANGHVLDDIEKYSDAVKWAQPCQLFRNTGRRAGPSQPTTPNSQLPTFDDVSQSTGIGEGSYVSRGAAFGDLFNRGRTDIVVSVLRGEPLVWKNDCAPDAHWLEMELHARWGNPAGIGATVTVKSNGLVQKRVVRSAASFASSNDIRPLFGLGASARVEEVRVRWPSGKETVLVDPPIDRILPVEEERGSSSPSKNSQERLKDIKGN